MTMTMDKVYQHRSSALTTTTGNNMATLNRPIHTNGLNGSVSSLVTNPKLPSRLPQRRESKLSGPTSVNQSPSGCVLNGVSSSSSSTTTSTSSPFSCQSTATITTTTTVTPTSSVNCTSIAPPKKFLSSPCKLLSNQGTGITLGGNDAPSLRSVSPATMFKCKSTQSHLIVPSSSPSSSTVTTGSTVSTSPAFSSTSSSSPLSNLNTSFQNNLNINNANSEINRGIRPPRLSSSSISSNILSPSGSMSTGKSLLTVSRSHITKHSVINNGLATVGRSGSSIQSYQRSVTLREVKDDKESTHRFKTNSSSMKSPSTSSSLGTTGQVTLSDNNSRGNNNCRSTTGSLASGLNANRSDSTPSLSENESGSERKTVIVPKKSFIRSNFTKGLGERGGGVGGHNISSSKSRPTSVCIENSSIVNATVTASPSSLSITSTTPSSTTSSMSSVNSLSKGIAKSGLRPLSSSGIPKTGLPGFRGTLSVSKANEESPHNEALAVTTRRRPAGESLLVPTRSEPNVARVSPIRRSIGQLVRGENGSNSRSGGVKEDTHHQRPKQQPSPQYTPSEKVNEDGNSSTGLVNGTSSTSNDASSSSNVNSNVITSTCLPIPLSSSSLSLSSSLSTHSSLISSSTSTITVAANLPDTTPILQLPLGSSSLSRSSEPILPILSTAITTSVTTTITSSLSKPSANPAATLKSVIEEKLPIKARSTLSISSLSSSPTSPTSPSSPSSTSSPINLSFESKDVYPRIKTIDLSCNVLSLLESNRKLSGSCDLLNSSNCHSSKPSTVPTFNSTNTTDSIPSYGNTFLPPILFNKDHCNSPIGRLSIDSPFESSFNQTIIDSTKCLSLTDKTLPQINGDCGSVSEKIGDYVNNNNSNRIESNNHTSSDSLLNNVPVSSSKNFLDKLNRRNKCTLPSEAELNLKSDLRSSNSNINGLINYEPIMDLTSNGSEDIKIPATPPPLLTHQPTTPPISLQPPPPPPLILSSGGLSLTNQVKRLSKNGDLRGSMISLLSGSSSLSATEERHNHEVKKLRDDLNRANCKVETLTLQLRNSNDMMQTFGKSLETLRTRLYQCSLATDQKDREIARLKTTIEVLRRECAINNGDSSSNGGNQVYSSSDFESRREKNKKRAHKEPRSPSQDRDGTNLESSGSSGWFKGSFQRAFKKNRSRNKSGGSMSDAEGSISRLNHGADSSSLPSTPLKECNVKADPFVGLSSMTNASTATSESNNSLDTIVKEKNDLIEDLKKQLRDKEKQLNEIRLEVLLTAFQTQSLNDQISRMDKEMSLLRCENHRLQCLLRRLSITTSTGSLTSCFEGTVSPCNGNN